MRVQRYHMNVNRVVRREEELSKGRARAWCRCGAAECQDLVMARLRREAASHMLATRGYWSVL